MSLPPSQFGFALFAADVRIFEQPNWELTINILAGIEGGRPETQRRFRLPLKGQRGFKRYGRCVNQKIESFGIGLYLACERPTRR